MARGERVLITGGTGFLGANLVRSLIADGVDVHLLQRSAAVPWRLADQEGRYAAHAGDLDDPKSVTRVVREVAPAVVYHLAAGGVKPDAAGCTPVVRTNVLGFSHLLDAIEGQAVRAVVSAGSGWEYGTTDRPACEDDPPNPLNEYAAAKAAATLLGQAAARRGVPVATVRVFGAYGPWEDPARLVPYLMACRLKGERARVTAGTQVRDFIHAHDVVALFRRAADCPAARGRVLHAATGVPTRVRELVELVTGAADGTGPGADFGSVPDRPWEPQYFVGDIGRTTALTGWRPRWGLRDGVAQTWEWFRAHAGRTAAAPTGG